MVWKNFFSGLIWFRAKEMTSARMTEIGTVTNVIKRVLVKADGPVREKKVLSKVPTLGSRATKPKTTP